MSFDHDDHMFWIEIFSRLPGTSWYLKQPGSLWWCLCILCGQCISLTTPQEGLLLNPWDMPLPSRLVLEDTGVPWRSDPGGVGPVVGFDHRSNRIDSCISLSLLSEESGFLQLDIIISLLGRFIAWLTCSPFEINSSWGITELVVDNPVRYYHYCVAIGTPTINGCC